VNDTIIVDDFSPQCRLEGVWADNKSNGYSGAGTIGDRFHYTSRYDPFKKTGREKAFFTPTLPTAGRYRVDVSWRATGNRTSKATYEVHFQGGTRRFTINQRDGSGMTWKTLGTFPFEAGTSGQVVFVSDGGGSGAVDAARFTFVGAETGGGSLDDVINGAGAGNTGGAGVRLDSANPGARVYTLDRDAKVRVEAFLTTYGSANLSLRLKSSNGPVRTILEWSRTDDRDAAPCVREGNPLPESMFEQKPGDFTPKPVVFDLDAKKGDSFLLQLEGNFGAAEPYLSVQPAP